MATAITVVPAVYQGDVTLFPGQAAASEMTFLNNGISVFYVQNLNAAPTIVTVTSVPDELGRGGTACTNLIRTVTQNQVVMFGPFTAAWWNQSDGTISVAFSAITTVTVYGVQIA